MGLLDGCMFTLEKKLVEIYTATDSYNVYMWVCILLLDGIAPKRTAGHLAFLLRYNGFNF